MRRGFRRWPGGHRPQRLGFGRWVGRECGVGVFFEAGPAVEVGDVGAGVEDQQAVGVARDDGEDGGGDAAEVVVFPCGAAYAVVLNVEEEGCIIGETADVFGAPACGGVGLCVGGAQALGDIDRHLFALCHDEDVARRGVAFAEVLDVGAEDAAGVDSGRIDDEQAPFEAADAHFLERGDDGGFGAGEVAAEVAAEVVCVDGGFHLRCKDKARLGRVYP